jgi:signal transduction histidine kinase
MTWRLWTVAGVCLTAGLVAAAALLWGGYETSRDDLVAALALTLGVGWSFAALGVVAAARWPVSRVGYLMIAVGLTWFARTIGALDARWAFEVAVLSGALYLALLGHLVVTYPSGRVESRAQLIVVTAGYLCTVPMATLARWVVPDGEACPTCRFNLVVGGDPGTPSTADRILLLVVVITATAALALVVTRWRDATPASRRSIEPALWGAMGILAVLVVQRLGVVAHVSDSVATVLSWALTGVLMLWPIGLVVGLARARLDRSAVADLVVELGGRMPAGGIRDALARALHDPSLQLAFWLPDERFFVDEAGRRVEDPTGSQTASVTVLARDGEPVAALTHDPSLSAEPGLVSAVAAAAGLAVENERLYAQVQAHLVETRASRTRLVAAADAERRRVERNLHDGAQQRMLNLMLALRTAQTDLSRGAYQGADDALEVATGELGHALTELRELAHGIHPAVLTDSGLGPAVRALAQRSSVPVRVRDNLHGERITPAIEVTAYFIVSEALTNVAKHAAASEATVTLARQHDDVIIEVADDGVGGASSLNGTGLRGLQDRVDAYAGHLRIESITGQGTRLTAELPCE